MSSEWAEQPASPDSHGAPGKTLAAQREAMGWSVEQVADQLKLAVRQVIALEEGDYASLPGPAVVRGFIRAYAKILKIDAAPLVAMVALDAPAPSDATATTIRRDKPAAFSEVRFPTNGKRSSFPVLPLLALIVVAGAGAAAWHFGLIPTGALRGEAAPVTATAPASPAASTTVLPPPVIATVPAASTPVASTPVPSTSVPLISVPAPAGTAAPEAPAATPAAAPGANALVLDVREDSWIEVRRAKGAPLLSRLVKGGSTETVDINEPVTLVVGKPGAVSATLRGAQVELPPVPGSTISRVNIK